VDIIRKLASSSDLRKLPVEMGSLEQRFETSRVYLQEGHARYLVFKKLFDKHFKSKSDRNYWMWVNLLIEYGPRKLEMLQII